MTDRSEQGLVLYGEAYWLSPWGCACWVALREKGLAFTHSVAMMPGVRVLDALRSKIVFARIPALQHGPLLLSTSVPIVEYLEESFPAPRWPAVLPRTAGERAQARHITMATRIELLALRRDRPAWMLFYPCTPAPMGGDARAEADELVDAARRLVAAPPGFLFGEFTIADLDLAFALQRLRRTGEELPDELLAYIDLVWGRASVSEFVSHARPPNPPAEDVNTGR